MAHTDSLDALNDCVGGSLWRRMLLEHAYRGRSQAMPAETANAPPSKHAPVSIPEDLPVIVPFIDGRVKNVGPGQIQRVASGSRFNTALSVVVD
ncbi:hypothetical protein H4R19_006067 [Coemansia spiralis]|nr:hypothetical protein H4R19_006067 [Coemansia spiralis]